MTGSFPPRNIRYTLTFMTMRIVLYRFFLLSLGACFFTATLSAQDHAISLNTLTLSGNAEFSPSGGGSYLLKTHSPYAGLMIDDPGVLRDIPKVKYLVIGIRHHNPYSGIINLEFFTLDSANRSLATAPRLSAKIGILPDLQTWLIFPFSYLDGQQIFLPRVPRQLKGVVFGSRIDPSEIAAIKLIPGPYAPPSFEPVFEIDTMYLSSEIPVYDSPPGQPLVDAYGQWNTADWPGKTHNPAEFEGLKNELQTRADSDSQFPGNLSPYGGWKELRFDSTGFFHTHFDGKRWWFADPDGYAFLSFGMDCVQPGLTGVIGGNEDLYSRIPPRDSGYAFAYQDMGKVKLIDFFRVNMHDMFGSGWRTKWTKITRNKLVSSGFNTVGNWSDSAFSRNSRMPYVLPLSGFPVTEVFLFRDFPDAFSPQYKINARRFAQQLLGYRDDPFLVGYFLRNEPQWAFGDHDLAFEMFATGDLSFTKMAFAKWLGEKYGDDLGAFNKAWNLNLKAFADLNVKVFKRYPSEASRKDFAAFTDLMVDKYVGTVCDEVKKVDPNHLNLGMRYAYISSPLLYRAGEYFDVYSINGYHTPGPPPTADIYKITGKPVMIGEFHFGAIDRGLPSTGLCGVASTEGRGRAYRYYLEQGFSRPELIGIHYFQWMDQPVAGRYDGENYNIGFNDILYRSYTELFEAAARTHGRLYRVASGKKHPFSKKAKVIPSIAF